MLSTQRTARRIIAGLLISVVLLLLGLTSSVAADTAIRVISNEHEAQFADYLTFRIVAESDAPIVEATLRYHRESSVLTTKVEVPITTGKHVEAEYVRSLKRGELPPGTALTYSWTLADESGKKHSTEPITFVYEDDRFDWQILSADGIALYWYGDESNARTLLTAGTEALHRIQDEVGITLEKPIKIFTYQTSSDMQPAVAARSKGYDARVVTLGMVISDDTMLLLSSHRDAELTIAHELSHLVVGLATKNPYADLPRWLDEGLAMYAEGELPAGNQSALDRAIRDDNLISVRSLSGYTGDPELVDLYYGEVYSLVDYLIDTYGQEKMTGLLAMFREGSRPEDALRQIYGFGLDELDSYWRASLGLGPRGEPHLVPDLGATPEARPTTRCLVPLLSMLAIMGIFHVSRHL